MTSKYNAYLRSSFNFDRVERLNEFMNRTVVIKKQPGNKKEKPKLITFTPKQMEYLNNSNKRFNIFGGATGSGKTFLGMFILKNRIEEFKGKKGAVALIGHSRDSFERNVLSLMRSFFGRGRVSSIYKGNKVKLFGQECDIFGAEKVTGINRIRGMTVKYAYGDEIVSWNDGAWAMVNTRIRADETSKFDGTCNPEGPEHTFKVWMDEHEEEMRQKGKEPLFYYLTTTIWDGKLNEDSEIDLKMKQDMYDSRKGVYRLRYMYGLWARAEGIIFEHLANNPDILDTKVSELPIIDKITVGVDFGESTSKHAFVATGYNEYENSVYALETKALDAKKYRMTDLGPELLKFVRYVESKYKEEVLIVYYDHASPGKGDVLRDYFEGNNKFTPIVGCIKLDKIIRRIDLVELLINTGRLFITEFASELKFSLQNAAWDPNGKEDRRLDKPGMGMDTLDAFEYTITPDIDYLMETYRNSYVTHIRGDDYQ